MGMTVAWQMMIIMRSPMQGNIAVTISSGVVLTQINTRPFLPRLGMTSVGNLHPMQHYHKLIVPTLGACFTGFSGRVFLVVGFAPGCEIRVNFNSASFKCREPLDREYQVHMKIDMNVSSDTGSSIWFEIIWRGMIARKDVERVVLLVCIRNQQFSWILIQSFSLKFISAFSLQRFFVWHIGCGKEWSRIRWWIGAP